MRDYKKDSGNDPVYPHIKKDHVESYFLKLNVGEQALWVKFTWLRGAVAKDGVADVWAIWFDRQHAQIWKTSYSPAECSHSGEAEEAGKAPGLRFGTAQWTGNRCSGSLKGEAGEIRWDLQLTPLADPLFLLGQDFLYADGFPGMKILSPLPAALVNGVVHVNGKEIRIQNAPGMQGHNWGRKHSYHYCWGHCSAFEAEDPSVYFEGFSAKIKLGPVITPYLSMAVLHIDGRTLRWTSLRKAASHNIQSDENSWSFAFSDNDFRLTGKMISPQFAELDYVNPDGRISLCRNSKQARFDLELLDLKTGSARTLRSNATALELLDLTDRRVG